MYSLCDMDQSTLLSFFSDGPLRRHSGRRKPCKSMGPSVPGTPVSAEGSDVKKVGQNDVSGWAEINAVEQVEVLLQQEIRSHLHTIGCKKAWAIFCQCLALLVKRRPSISDIIRPSQPYHEYRKCGEAAEDKGPSTSMGMNMLNDGD